jgi:hypothetical protein
MLHHRYPTPEEIMQEPHVHYPKTVINYMHKWKRGVWKPARGDRRMKIEAITCMINDLASLYNKPITRIIWSFNAMRSCYDHNYKTLVMNEVSIITGLHELSHHLFGSNEYLACRWSVHLFIKTFPVAFSKLHWKGHTLKRRV